MSWRKSNSERYDFAMKMIDLFKNYQTFDRRQKSRISLFSKQELCKYIGVILSNLKGGPMPKGQPARLLQELSYQGVSPKFIQEEILERLPNITFSGVHRGVGMSLVNMFRAEFNAFNEDYYTPPVTLSDSSSEEEPAIFNDPALTTRTDPTTGDTDTQDGTQTGLKRPFSSTQVSNNDQLEEEKRRRIEEEQKEAKEQNDDLTDADFELSDDEEDR